MPPYRRRTSRSRSRGRRRKLVWAQRTASNAQSANNQWSNFDLLQEYKAATGASSVGVTIIRTHVWVLPHAPAAGDTFWVGLHIGDLDQVTTNTTNAFVSNPHDNPYIDWMWASKYEFDVNLRVIPQTTTDAAGAVIDLRAKRRMDEVQEAYLLTVYQDTVGTVAKTYDIFARTLIALP